MTNNEEKLTVSVEEKIKAQERYCDKTNAPFFAPHNGGCYSCGAQIWNTISLETAENSLITDCPLCHRSYCD